MQPQLEINCVDLKIVNPDAKQELGLCAFAGQNLRRVLELAATRLRVSGEIRELSSLRIRREGELLPLDCNALVGEILRSGDRLIVEPVAGTERGLAEPDDVFRSAAARITGGAVSTDSATFLRLARQNVGE